MSAPQRVAQIILGSEHVAEIARHGEASYPDECCGVLFGREADGVRTVEQLRPLDNSWDAEERQRRFLIEPRDVLAAEREARRLGLDILGFYHSHPDDAARPSEFDREHAWPWYTYLITSIEEGQFATLAGWQLRDDRTGYEEVIIG